MAPHRPLKWTLLVVVAWTLACANNPPPPEFEIVGIWSRDAGGGVIAIREFISEPEMIVFTNRNSVVVDGAFVGESEGRYFVTEDDFVPGGGTRKRVLRSSNSPTGQGFSTYDEIVSVNGNRLVLRSLADEQDYEYEKNDTLEAAAGL